NSRSGTRFARRRRRRRWRSAESHDRRLPLADQQNALGSVLRARLGCVCLMVESTDWTERQYRTGKSRADQWSTTAHADVRVSPRHADERTLEMGPRRLHRISIRSQHRLPKRHASPPSELAKRLAGDGPSLSVWKVALQHGRAFGGGHAI